VPVLPSSEACLKAPGSMHCAYCGKLGVWPDDFPSRIEARCCRCCEKHRFETAQRALGVRRAAQFMGFLALLGAALYCLVTPSSELGGPVVAILATFLTSFGAYALGLELYKTRPKLGPP
jgi:hypothetical protein